MGVWTVVQIIAACAFVSGYLMFIGGGITAALTDGKIEAGDKWYEFSFALGGFSTLLYIAASVLNHSVFPVF